MAVFHAFVTDFYKEGIFMTSFNNGTLPIKYCPVCGYGDETIFMVEADDFSSEEDGTFSDEFTENTEVNGIDWTCQNCHHEVGAYWYGITSDKNAFAFGDDDADEAAAERRLFFSMLLTIGLFIAFVYFFV